MKRFFYLIIFCLVFLALMSKSFTLTDSQKTTIDFLKSAQKSLQKVSGYSVTEKVIGYHENIPVNQITGQCSSMKNIMSLIGKYFTEEAAMIELSKMGLYVFNGQVGIISAAGEEAFEINEKSQFEFVVDNNSKKVIKILMVGEQDTKKYFYYFLKKINNQWKITDEVSEYYARSYKKGRVIIRSSSDYYDGKLYHTAANIWDKDPKTFWGEGKSDDGIGEWLRFTLVPGQVITSIKLINGYAKNETIYQANNRVKRIKLAFEDGTSFEADLKDNQMDYQIIKLPKPKMVDDFKLIILDVYQGTKYKDTCISEVDIQ